MESRNGCCKLGAGKIAQDRVVVEPAILSIRRSPAPLSYSRDERRAAPRSGDSSSRRPPSHLGPGLDRKPPESSRASSGREPPDVSSLGYRESFRARGSAPSPQPPRVDSRKHLSSHLAEGLEGRRKPPLGNPELVVGSREPRDPRLVGESALLDIPEDRTAHRTAHAGPRAQRAALDPRCSRRAYEAPGRPLPQRQPIDFRPRVSREPPGATVS